MILIATPAPDSLLTHTLERLHIPDGHPLFLRRDGHTVHLLMPRQDTPTATITVSGDRRQVQASTPGGTFTISELRFNRAANTFETAVTERLPELNEQINALHAENLIQDLITDYAHAENFSVTEFFPDAQDDLIDALLFSPSYPNPDAPQYVGVNLIRLPDRYRLTSGRTSIADYVHNGHTWTWTPADTSEAPQPEPVSAAQPSPEQPHPEQPAPEQPSPEQPNPEQPNPEQPTTPAPTTPRQLFTPNPIPAPRNDT